MVGVVSGEGVRETDEGGLGWMLLGCEVVVVTVVVVVVAVAMVVVSASLPHDHLAV